MKKTKRILAIIMAIAMAFSFAVPAMTLNAYNFVPSIVPVEGLPTAHEAFGEESIMPLYWPAPVLQVTPEGTATEPEVDGLVHRVSWVWVGEDPDEFIVYVFNSPTESNPSNAVRRHVIQEGSVRHLDIPVFGSRGAIPGEPGIPGMPFPPLPHGDYFLRVMGIAPHPVGPSRLSYPTPALQFGRRVTTAQQAEVIDEHEEQFPDAGFIIIDIRDNWFNHNEVRPDTEHTTTTTIFPGAIRIPFENQNSEGNMNIGGVTDNYRLPNQRFLERVQHELKAHPNYNGPDTLIFIH